MEFKALMIYGYYDGPTLFTAQTADRFDVYLFRWTASGDEVNDLLEHRTYKADGHDITIKENEVDWSEAET